MPKKQVEDETVEATDKDLIDEPQKEEAKVTKAPKKDYEVDEADSVEAGVGEVTEQEVIKGVPNRVTPRTVVTRVAGKEYALPVHFVARTEAGSVAYGPTGARTSFPTKVTSEILALGRKVAHMNATAQRNAVVAELKPAVSSR